LIEGGRKFPVTQDPRFEVFLDNLKAGMTVAESMTEAGLYWRRLYFRKNTDPEFQAAWEDAMVQGGRRLGDTADPRFDTFILSFKETGSILEALAASKLECRSLYHYRLRNRKFQKIYDQLMKEHCKGSKYEDPRFEVFLNALRNGKTVYNAMRESALNWKTLYALKHSAPEFREDWEAAVMEGGRLHSKFKVITDDVVEKFLSNIADGVPVKKAAEKAGVTIASIYKKSSREPELEAAWEKAYKLGKSRNLKLKRETNVFLKQIEEGRTVGHAAKIAGKDVTTFYRLKKKDGEFAERWEDVNKKRRNNQFKVKLTKQRDQRKRVRELSAIGESYDKGAQLPAAVDTVFESTAANLKSPKTIEEHSIPAEEKRQGRRDNTYELLDELRESIAFHNMPKITETE
jgi:hypothetical protein